MTSRFRSRAIPLMVAGAFGAGLLAAGLFHLPHFPQAQRPAQAEARPAAACLPEAVAWYQAQEREAGAARRLPPVEPP